jgi:hypothetical protein
MISNNEIQNLLFIGIDIIVVLFSLFYLLTIFVSWRQVSIVDDQIITPTKGLVEFLNVFNVFLVSVAFLATLIIIFV